MINNSIDKLEKVSLNVLKNKINNILLKKIIFDLKDNNINSFLKWEKQEPPFPDFIVYYENKTKAIEMTTAFRDSQGINNNQKRYSLFLVKSKILNHLLSKIANDLKDTLIKEYFLNKIDSKFPLSEILLMEIYNGKIINNTTYINNQDQERELPNNTEEWLGNDILNILKETVSKHITFFLKNNSEKILNNQTFIFNFKPIDVNNLKFDIVYTIYWPFNYNEQDFSTSLSRMLKIKTKKSYKTIDNCLPQLFILIDFKIPFFFSKKVINWEKSQFLIEILSNHQWSNKFSKLVLYHKNYFLVFNKENIWEHKYFEDEKAWKSTKY